MADQTSKSIRAACIQMNSDSDQHANLERASSLLEKCAEQHANLVLLPENFSFMGADESEKLTVSEAQHSSSILAYLSDQARKHGVVIVGGTIPLKGSSNGKIRNSCPVFSTTGELITCYDKMHLFDVAVSDEQYRESDTVEAGREPQTANFDGWGFAGWKLGLSICYDLRFPELYRHYSSVGCNILTVPAAFTVPTGKAHWEALLRARAIENQAYVLAAGQCGTHPDGRKTWGHSMIISPWGEVLATQDDDEGIITAEISLNKLNEIRQAMPLLNHRRV